MDYEHNLARADFDDTFCCGELHVEYNRVVYIIYIFASVWIPGDSEASIIMFLSHLNFNNDEDSDFFAISLNKPFINITADIGDEMESNGDVADIFDYVGGNKLLSALSSKIFSIRELVNLLGNDNIMREDELIELLRSDSHIHMNRLQYEDYITSIERSKISRNNIPLKEIANHIIENGIDKDFMSKYGNYFKYIINHPFFISVIAEGLCDGIAYHAMYASDHYNDIIYDSSSMDHTDLQNELDRFVLENKELKISTAVEHTMNFIKTRLIIFKKTANFRKELAAKVVELYPDIFSKKVYNETRYLFK